MGVEKVPEKMLAAQVVEYNKPYKIHEVSTPKDLKPHDLLVKVAVAGLCHTDSMVSEGVFGTKLPCTGSHEGTGTVAAVGSEVTKFKEGDRVMCGIFRDFCGVCRACQGPEKYKQYCSNNGGGIGVHINGCFAEYVTCDANIAAHLPDKVSYQTAAPLACAGSTVYRAILQTELTKGQWVAIVGSGGGLGHLGLQFAKALGLNVVGVDARDEGLQLTKDTGADLVVDARQGDEKVVEEVHKVTNGEGVDATVNVSDAMSAAATSCAITKRHGTLVQIAQPETVNIPFAELIFRDIRVKGSLICSPQESVDMLKCVADNNITVKTNPYVGLKKIPDLVDYAHSGKMQGKGIVIVDEEQVNNQRKDAV